MEESIREGPVFPTPSTPIHCIQHSRFETEDGWKLEDISLSSSGDIAVSGYHNGTKRTFIDIYAAADFNSGDKPTLYSKEFEEYSHFVWPDYRPWRYISFGEYHLYEIITCVDDKIQVIDFERDRVLRTRKVHGRTVSLSVYKKQMFVGFYDLDIVSIYDKDLNRIRSIMLKDTDSEWPRDMAAAGELFLCTWYGKAVVVKQGDGSTQKEYSTEQYYLESSKGRRRQYTSKAHSIAVNEQLGVAVIVWNKKRIDGYHICNDRSFPILYDESNVSKIRISNQGTIVTGNTKGVVKKYELGHFFTFEQFKNTLTSIIQRGDCEKLMDVLSISKHNSEMILSSDTPTKALLLHLENKCIIQPFNVDAIEGAFSTLRMDHPLIYQVINLYKKTRGNLSLMKGALVYKEQYMDEQGGVLLVPEANVSLLIPPGAIKQGIIMSITIPKDGFWPGSEDQCRTTPTIICEPDGLTFIRPVELVIQHCAVFETSKKHNVTVTFGGKKSNFSPEMTWETEKVDYQLTDHFCRLRLTHFSTVGTHIEDAKEKILRVIPYAESGKHTNDFVLVVWFCNDIETDYQSVIQGEEENEFIPLDSYDTFHLLLGEDTQCTTISVTLEPLDKSSWIPDKTEKRIEVFKLSTASKSKCTFRLCKNLHSDSSYIYLALKVSQNDSNGDERETSFILRRKVCDLMLPSCSNKPYIHSGNETCILTPPGKPPTGLPKICTAVLYIESVTSCNDDIILTLWLSSHDSSTSMFKSLHKEQEFHLRKRVDTENSISINDDKSEIVTKPIFRNGNWSLSPDNKRIKPYKIRSGSRAKFQFIAKSRENHSYSYIDLEVEIFQEGSDGIRFMRKVQFNRILRAAKTEAIKDHQAPLEVKVPLHKGKERESNKSKVVLEGFKRLCESLGKDLSKHHCKILGESLGLKSIQLEEIQSSENPSSVMFCKLQESCICITEKVAHLQNGLTKIDRNDLAAKVALFKKEVSDKAMPPRFGSLQQQIARELSLESSLRIATIFEVPEMMRQKVEESVAPGLEVMHILVKRGCLSDTYTEALKRALLDIDHIKAAGYIDQYNVI